MDNTLFHHQLHRKPLHSPSVFNLSLTTGSSAEQLWGPLLPQLEKLVHYLADRAWERTGRSPNKWWTDEEATKFRNEMAEWLALTVKLQADRLFEEWWQKRKYRIWYPPEEGEGWKGEPGPPPLGKP